MVNTPPEELCFAKLSSFALHAKDVLSSPKLPYIFSKGQTLQHNPQSIHLFLSITGYLKPSKSACIVIASFGQIAKQAVQPLHFKFFCFNLFSIFITISTFNI